MLGIQVAGTFLQLAPGSTAQLTRNNPFLTKDAIDGEYSPEVSIMYTEDNCKALDFIFNYYTRRQKTTVDATLYDGNAMAYRGQLVLQTANLNINSPQTAVIKGYFITGVSSFIYQVKDKLLKDVDFGTRSFPWTTSEPYDASLGFWQHVHYTWFTNQFGYVFYPVRNEGWQGDDSDVDYMNKMERNPTSFRLSIPDNYLSLCPHLYLSFVLQRLFAVYGYTLSGDVLQDPDFQKLTIVSFRSIDWVDGANANTPRPTITFKLGDHLPPKWKVTDLLIELQQYFACTFIIDPITRTVELTALKSLRTSGKKKDWTQYAEPALESNFSQDTKKYALKTEIDSNDGLPGSAIDLEGKTVLPPVENHGQLFGLASANSVDKYVYCFRDNAWYIGTSQRVNLGGGFTITLYDFAPTNYNIFSYEPTGFTDSIESKINTLAMQYTLEAAPGSTPANPNRWARLYPGCSQEGNWPGKIGQDADWGLRLLFYRGMAAEIKVEETPTGQSYGANGFPYPYATSTRGDLRSYSVPFGLWALPYTYLNPTTGEDAGVYNYWWKPWLDCLESAGETNTFTLWLPRYELQQHRWTDIILIRNVPYLVQSFTEDLPYPGFVQAEMLRIG